MSKENKIVLLTVALYFLLISHVWFPSIGITGLGIQQNNLSWLWVVAVCCLSFFLISTRGLKIPCFWKWGSIALACSLLPFVIIHDFAIFRSGLLLVAGYLTIWIFILALYQFDALKGEANKLILIILGAVFIQVIWGAYEIISASVINYQSGQLLIEPTPLGVFNQRNAFASFVATGIVLSFYYILSPFKEVRYTKVTYAIFFVFVFLASFTVAYTVSRAGIIGLIIGVALLIPLILSKKQFGVAIGVVLVILASVSADYISGLAGNIDKQIVHGGPRVGYYLTSVMAIFEKPILGHGLGSFEHVFLEKFAELYDAGKIPVDNDYHGNLVHPHNELLLWGIQGGLITIVSLLALVFILAKALWTRLTYFLASISLFVPILVHSMFEMPFYQSTLHLIVLGVLFVIAYKQVATLKQEESKDKEFSLKGLSSALRMASVIFFVFFLAVFTLNILSLNKAKEFVYDEQDLQTIESVYIKFGWPDTYNYFYKASLSRFGRSTGNTFFCNDYINWAEKVLEVSPRLDYYRDLALAYECIGEYERARETALRLKYYYPTHRKTQDWVNGYLGDNL